MKIIATDDNLNLLETYDLGDSIKMKGPDQDRFNRDITTGSDRLYVDQDEYLRLLRARHVGTVDKAEREDQAASERSRLRLVGEGA